MKISRAVWSWSMYDWANSVFATTVMVAFFPEFFKNFWCGAIGTNLSTERLGIGNTVAGIIIGILSLILGAFADTGRDKKKLLGFFMLLGVITTGCLFFIPQGSWLFALVIFGLANIGYSCSILFYDSLIVEVAEKERMDFVSSLGFAMGYLGGGLLFGVNMLMVMKPHYFGLQGPAQAVRYSFFTAAVWWLLFSLPILIFVKYTRYARVTGARAIARDSFARLKKTTLKIMQRRELLLFLCAYWLYYDGVNTFIRMATDFGRSIGIPLASVMIALLLVQFIALPASLLFGHWAGRFGARRMIITGIIIYLIVIGLGVFFLTKPIHFILFACMTALAQGGVQALSRSYFGKLVPREDATEYFGFYNVVGRFAIIGPAMVGIIAQTVYGFGMEPITASRIGMASTALLFLSGGALLVAADHARIKGQVASEKKDEG
jgi:UMF1 family MFS transporter